MQNIAAVDDFESRQFDATVDFKEKLEVERQNCLIRLRHMEAYCHSPSPPPTPKSELALANDQLGEKHFPGRKVTDKDYHNLAAQYRERDAMPGLHQARMEVHLAKQEREYARFVAERTRGLAQLVAGHNKLETKLDNNCGKEEKALEQSFADKASRLRSRWKIQGLILCAKLERQSGLKYAAPHELSISLPPPS